MSYKLLALDIDGTFVNKNNVIGETDKATLCRVRDAGIAITLCTGRVAPACHNVMCQLPWLDGYHVFADGAFVGKQQGEEIISSTIKSEILLKAVAFAREHGIDIELYSSTRYFSERETWSTQAHRDFFDLPAEITNLDAICCREKIIKAGMVVREPAVAEKTRRFCAEFESQLDFSWAWTPAYPETHFINVIAPNVSKGKALTVLAQKMGIPLEQVMAVGDGSNDYSLLSVAGLAVAMANAPDNVKAVADYITEDVEKSGLTLAIEKFLLQS